MLKKMEIKEREQDEAVDSRAKAKTKRVIGTRPGAGSFGSSAGGEVLLHSDFYYTLKIRFPSRSLPFLPWTPQSPAKPWRAHTVSPLPPVRLLEQPEHRITAGGLLRSGN